MVFVKKKINDVITIPDTEPIANRVTQSMTSDKNADTISYPRNALANVRRNENKATKNHMSDVSSWHEKVFTSLIFLGRIYNADSQ